LEERDLASAAADSLDAGLAVIDPAGQVTWSNAAWHEGHRSAGRPGLETLAELSGRARGSAAAVIEAGIRSVIEGDSTRFHLVYSTRAEPRRTIALTATPLRGAARGAVVTRTQLGPAQDGRDLGARAGRSDAAPPLDRLTPRELQILTLMARGLPNREIARELEIEYTTVRGYVQSLIQKFGANSRLECVAMAYRWRMVE
jgi:DNA-binding NarL/FixJ family response regulator